MVRRSRNISVVTGAGGGIGSSVVEACMRRGDRVVAADLARTALDELTERMRVAFGRAVEEQLLTALHDVADFDDWQRLHEAVDKHFGSVNVLVNNAGISPKHNGMKLEGVDIPLEEWKHVLDVNLTGSFLGIQTFAPGMKQQQYGRIINMSSLAGRSGGRIGGIHYAATKTGILGVTRAFARELAGDGITVNAVAPGRIAAGMVSMMSDEANEEYRQLIPIGRLGSADDVSSAVMFLSAPENGFITGATIDVNGGTHMQ